MGCAVGHASQEACELKFTVMGIGNRTQGGHASQEACELKLS